MEIKQITSEKKRFLDLLLLADEQESMIDKYLEKGDLFALYDPDLKSVCVVLPLGEGVYEIKNLATYAQFQKQGYGRALIHYAFEHYKGTCRTMLVGTGDSPLTIPFYKKSGFTLSHRIPNFFTDNYDHPMFEEGVQLVDMVYLRKDF